MEMWKDVKLIELTETQHNVIAYEALEQAKRLVANELTDKKRAEVIEILDLMIYIWCYNAVTPAHYPLLTRVLVYHTAIEDVSDLLRQLQPLHIRNLDE